jgi:hypothetical protein
MLQDRAKQECTDSPVFLFQVNRIIVRGYPDGYESDGESVWWNSDDEGFYGDELSDKDLTKILDLDGIPYAFDNWETEKVYLTREDGEKFGRSREYRWPNGWRVYAVTADEKLKEIILKGESL